MSLTSSDVWTNIISANSMDDQTAQTVFERQESGGEGRLQTDSKACDKDNPEW